MWSIKDAKYTSVNGGEHPEMEWVVNNPLSVNYYEIIISDPTYTTCHLIVAPFISFRNFPFKAKVSTTYGKGYFIVTYMLTSTPVPYHCVSTTSAHIAFFNTAPLLDAIQSVVNTHFLMHLSTTFKHYHHFQKQKYTT
jgi:hypothetical protein